MHIRQYGGLEMLRLILGVIGVWFLTASAAAGDLEIHYINVRWGGAILVRGPDGTTVLLEAGNDGRGTDAVVPYLRGVGIAPTNGLDYLIAGHQDCDHVGGLDEVLGGGYAVWRRVYYNGSPPETDCARDWMSAAAMSGVTPVRMMPGDEILLGDGARMICVASGGDIIGGGHVNVTNENDRSLMFLVRYGGFDFLWGSDAGGGDDDQACTGRSTPQKTIESPVIRAISPGGARPLISAGGIDVLHVNHPGSESSTTAEYMNRARPEVAVISVGGGQSGWGFPRKDIVHGVLLANAPCVTALPAFVLQTEEDAPPDPDAGAEGFAVGDIVISTTGSLYTIRANGRVTEGPNEVAASGLPRVFTVDDPVVRPPARRRHSVRH